MAGLMGVTAFLSMWINNSASANIMIPTALAIVSELQTYQQVTKQKGPTSDNDNEQDSTGSAMYLFEYTADILPSSFVATSESKSTEPSFAHEHVVVVSSERTVDLLSSTHVEKTLMTDEVDYDQLKFGITHSHVNHRK
jgi:hypothetical protein